MTAGSGHPNHQPDTSRPLDVTEGACTCGYVSRREYVEAHRARCAAWWDSREADAVQPDVM